MTREWCSTHFFDTLNFSIFYEHVQSYKIVQKIELFNDTVHLKTYFEHVHLIVLYDTNVLFDCVV